jgi:DNA polymerase I-like protein with 3'-5' exonuclease and polymerase domains
MKPGFMNVPNEYEIVVPEGYPELPIMRTYTLPDEGHVWLKRDYSQQELRIMSSYSEGRLYHRYQENPRIDAHVETSNIITEITGMELPRKHVKITGFSMIYGAGATGLAGQLGISVAEAAMLRSAYFQALPEVRDLMEDCKERGRSGGIVTTWGGRGYPVEPPKIIAGQRRTFEYKLLNYLIQGSAADQTKEAIIRWWPNRGDSRFLATVHDEIDICAPKATAPKAMAALREAMESLEFDVKMLSDGFIGPSWGNLRECQ